MYWIKNMLERTLYVKINYHLNNYYLFKTNYNLKNKMRKTQSRGSYYDCN